MSEGIGERRENREQMTNKRDAQGKRSVRTSRSVSESGFNPFWETGRRALDALAMSDPSVAREAQGGRGHGVSGDLAVQWDHASLS